ncbi:cytochrome P450 2J4-like [Antedon mediterranea]|uniref:cytochrome P450 2J4-like n=1 Tax=Antedon mediterranea TaxID=105859 RepID=UPI003AF67C0E
MSVKQLPGPASSFLFGNVLQIDERPHLSWTKWSKEFGPIYKLSFGPMGDVVVLSGASQLSKAFEPGSDYDLAFSNRFRSPLFDKIGTVGSITFEDWFDGAKDRRRLLQEVIKAMDFERLLQKELNAVSDVLLKNKQVNICDVINQATSNIILTLTLNRGDRFQYTDVKFQTLIKVIDDCCGLPMLGSPINVMQCLWHTPLSSKIRRSFSCLNAAIQPYIDAHRAEFNKDKIRDLIDGYIGGVGDTSFDVQEVICNIFHIYPSSCSLRATMQWLILFIAGNEDVQIKIQAEIDSVLTDVGNEDYIDVISNKMPYMNAVIKESMRLGTSVCQLAPHCTMTDVNFEGYRIKKDTTIIANLYGPNHDPDTWSDPFAFKPERWLNNDNLPPFMPFGSGKRKCPASSISMNALRMLIVTLCLRFNLKGVEGEKLPGVDDSFIMNAINHPKQFNIVATTR